MLAPSEMTSDGAIGYLSIQKTPCWRRGIGLSRFCCDQNDLILEASGALRRYVTSGRSKVCRLDEKEVGKQNGATGKQPKATGSGRRLPLG